MLRLVVAVALGCGGSATGPSAPPDQPLPPPPPAGSDLAGECPITASTSAASVLRADHPCRLWVDALWGRMVSVGNGMSGTVWYVSARQSGVLATCQHCFAAGGGLRFPGGPEPITAMIGTSAELSAGEIRSDVSGDRVSTYRHAYALYAREIPSSAADARGNLTRIKPIDDWVVAAVSGKVVEVPGHLAAVPPEVIPPDPLEVRDPVGLLGVEDTGAPVAGELAITLGFPNVAGGALMFTVNRIHDDEIAADIISRAEPDERAIPYDPAVEFLMAGQLTVGNSGGGVFDRRGRYLGVMVRGSVVPVDGAHFVRVVRASHMKEQIEAALAGAEADLRERVAPYLTRGASPGAAP